MTTLSPHLAPALYAPLEPEGDQVVHLTDRFPANTEGRVWMAAPGRHLEIA